MRTKKLINSTDFWEKISKILFENNMSWATLAKETGLSAQSIATAKYAKSPLSTGTVIRVSKALGKAPSVLLFGIRKPSTQTEEDMIDTVLKSWKLAQDEGILRLLRCFTPDMQDTLLKKISIMIKDA